MNFSRRQMTGSLILLAAAVVFMLGRFAFGG
jgi:hypothetical protein